MPGEPPMWRMSAPVSQEEPVGLANTSRECGESHGVGVSPS